jgi:hypothetical protein
MTLEPPKPPAPSSARAVWPLAADDVLKALAHPLRIRLLTGLCERGPMTLKELANHVGEADSLALFHLDRLIAADLVSADYARPQLSTTTPGRGRGRVYAAREPIVLPESVWEELPRQFKELTAARLFRLLHRDAVDAMEHGHFAPGDAHLSLTPLVLDGAGIEEVKELLRRTVGELLAIQGDSAERSGAITPHGVAQSVTVGLIGFRSSRHPEEGARAPQTVRL